MESHSRRSSKQPGRSEGFKRVLLIKIRQVKVQCGDNPMRASLQLPSTVHRAALVALLMLLAVAAAACGTSPNQSSNAPTTQNGSAVQALLHKGITQAQAKQLGQAVTTFNDVLVLSPKNVLALYNLGVINQMESKTSAALGYYDRALTADSTYTPALFNKAILLEATDLDGALALYKEIVAINPKASTAYLRMAFVLAKQGQATQAEAARSKAIALDPSLAKYPLPAACATPNC
jgi:tetratricopeptide (TPR) repeat protein